jgi:crossover junction endodeoxyribonuclease RusA
MNEISFDLPWPPSANNYWRYFRGRMVVTTQAREYKKLVRTKIINTFEKFKKDVRICVFLIFYPPDNRKRDIDNLIKITLDAISIQREKKNGIFIVHEGLGFDDCQIDKLSAERREVIKNGLLNVRVLEAIK